MSTQPATPAAGADAAPEPQPCYVCRELVPPLQDGSEFPFYICPGEQAAECLSRAVKILRAEKDAETAPEETNDAH